MARDWLHLPHELHGKGLEVVLQAHALAGFPRTINALMKIHEVGLHPPDDKHIYEKHDLETWREVRAVHIAIFSEHNITSLCERQDGAKTLVAVYGNVADKLRANFKKMHPLLELIMVRSESALFFIDCAKHNLIVSHPKR